MKDESSGDRHLGKAELRYHAVTAADSRLAGRVDDCAAPGLPDVCRSVKVLALQGLQRDDNHQRHVFRVRVAQRHIERFSLTQSGNYNKNTCFQSTIIFNVRLHAGSNVQSNQTLKANGVARNVN